MRGVGSGRRREVVDEKFGYPNRPAVSTPYYERSVRSDVFQDVNDYGGPIP